MTKRTMLRTSISIHSSRVSDTQTATTKQKKADAEAAAAASARDELIQEYKTDSNDLSEVRKQHSPKAATVVQLEHVQAQSVV